MRELICKVECWDGNGDDFKQVGWIIAWKEENKFFVKNIDGLEWELEKLVAPDPIPDEHLAAPWREGWTEASKLLADVHIKTPEVARYSPKYPHLMRDRLSQEIEAYELLARNPHPNICPYYGCIREGDLVTGFAIKKCAHDLSKLDAGIRPAATRLEVLRGIKRGLDHLHSLGLVHDDLKPANIMFDEYARPVLIDFEMCAKEGAPREPTVGSAGWCKPGNICTKERDLFALGLIARWLDGDYEWQPDDDLGEDEPHSWTEEYLKPKVLAVSTESPAWGPFESLLSVISGYGGKVAYMSETESGTKSEADSSIRTVTGCAHDVEDVRRLWSLAEGGLRHGDVDIVMLSLASKTTFSEHAKSLEALFRAAPIHAREKDQQPALALFIDSDTDICFTDLELVISDSVRAAWESSSEAHPGIHPEKSEKGRAHDHENEDDRPGDTIESADDTTRATSSERDNGEESAAEPHDKPRETSPGSPIPAAIQNLALVRPISATDTSGEVEVIFWDTDAARFLQDRKHTVLMKDLPDFLLEPLEDLPDFLPEPVSQAKDDVNAPASQESERPKRKRSLTDDSGGPSKKVCSNGHA